MSNKDNKLSEFLLDLFCKFEEFKISYCVIGNYEKLPYHTDNDVDLWVEDIQIAEKCLMALAKDIGLSLYMQNFTAVGSNNYFYYDNGASLEIIKIDLMSETAYKSLFTLIPSDHFKKAIENYNGFFVANRQLEGAAHLLYPLVHTGFVKKKYREKIVRLSHDEIFIEIIVSILGKDLGLTVIELLSKEQWDSLEKTRRTIIQRIILSSVSTLTISRVKTYGRFIRSFLQRIFKKNGVTMSFTGIDGAGKTTLKNNFVEYSDRYFCKNKSLDFYWRPFFLPRIACLLGSKGQGEKFVSSGRRVISDSLLSILKSYVKYFYYVLDFILGQARYYVITHTGGSAIFDRYHFDNIVYPERFGFSVNKSIMRMVDRHFIPQPDLMFYFTADSETLYMRKMEIDIKEIDNQKNTYGKEICLKNDIVIINTDCSVAESFKVVLTLMLKHMSERYR